MFGEEDSMKKFGPWCKRVAGKGPQHQMHAKYRSVTDSALRYIAQDNSYVDYMGKKVFARQYWLMSFQSLYDTMKFNSKNGIQNCFYELMPSSACTHGEDNIACSTMLHCFGTRAYLDVEFREPCDWVDFNTSALDPKVIGQQIVKMFHAHLEQFLECRCEMIILKSHRTNKLSWHFIAKCYKDDVEYLFHDSLAVMAAMEAWDKHDDLKMFEYNENDTLKNAIDTSVYSTHKLFRIYGNQKEGSNSGTLEFACYYPNKTGKPDFEDMLVLQPYGKTRLKFKLRGSDSTTKLQRQRVGAKRSSQSQNKTSKRIKRPLSHNHLALEQFFFGLDMWKDVKEHLKVYFKDVINFDMAQFKSVDTAYIPLATTKCPLNKGSYNGAHRTNHSYLYVYFSSGTCFWFCQDRDCQGKKHIDFPLDLKMRMREVYQRKKSITIQL
jgi:hypothetical protein